MLKNNKHISQKSRLEAYLTKSELASESYMAKPHCSGEAALWKGKYCDLAQSSGDFHLH